MKDKSKTGIKVEKTLDLFPAWPRQGEGCGPDASCPGDPASTFRCFAGVNIYHFQAVLAAHSTTPVEFALAFGHSADAGGVVASPAAHHLTAVHAAGGLVTNTTRCPEGPYEGKAGKVRRQILRTERTGK